MGQVDGFQLCAAQEGGVVDENEAFGQFDGFQVGAIHERAGAELLKVPGQAHLAQRRSAEGLFSDLNAVRNVQRCQFAQREGRALDVLDAVGHGERAAARRRNGQQRHGIPPVRAAAFAQRDEPAGVEGGATADAALDLSAAAAVVLRGGVEHAVYRYKAAVRRIRFDALHAASHEYGGGTAGVIQALAVGESVGIVAEVFQICRDGELFEPDAIGERAAVDAFQGRRQRHACQVDAASERFLVNRGDAVADHEGGDAGVVGKGPVGDIASARYGQPAVFVQGRGPSVLAGIELRIIGLQGRQAVIVVGYVACCPRIGRAQDVELSEVMRGAEVVGVNRDPLSDGGHGDALKRCAPIESVRIDNGCAGQVRFSQRGAVIKRAVRNGLHRFQTFDVLQLRAFDECIVGQAIQLRGQADRTQIGAAVEYAFSHGDHGIGNPDRFQRCASGKRPLADADQAVRQCDPGQSQAAAEGIVEYFRRVPAQGIAARAPGGEEPQTQ